MAERLGFDSVWTGEHIQTKWGGEQILFECVTMTTAIAMAVPRIGLGFTVLNSTLRNPALTAKMASTIDVVSNGRLTLGLGAGFRQDEVEAFGYEFPALGTRLSILEEHLEVISRMVTRMSPPSPSTAHTCVFAISSTTPAVSRNRGFACSSEVTGRTSPSAWQLATATRSTSTSSRPTLRTQSRSCINGARRSGRDPTTLAVSVGISPVMRWKEMQTYGQRMAKRTSWPLSTQPSLTRPKYSWRGVCRAGTSSSGPGHDRRPRPRLHRTSRWKSSSRIAGSPGLELGSPPEPLSA